MKLRWLVPVFLMLVVGCSSANIPLVIGEGVVIYWGDRGWIKNDYSHPIKVYCYSYRYSPGLLGAAKHEYPISWIITVQSGEKKYICPRYVHLNDHFKVYKGFELLERLKPTYISVGKKIAEQNDIGTEEELCDYVEKRVDKIREVMASGSGEMPL